MQKKIALLHRYPTHSIKGTNAAFPYLQEKGIDVLTFRTFNRLNNFCKTLKSFLWIFYSPFLVLGKGYDVIYCDDSFPFYPILIKIASPKSKIIIRLGDFHLMYYLSGWKYNLLHKLEKLGWKCANKILAISQAMQEKLEKEGFKSELVYDPIEPDDFMPNNKANKDKVVMFHGLITKNKNLDIMVKAAKYRPDYYFWVVGDGPDLERIKSIAPKNMIFTGWHNYEQVSELMDNCTIGLALRSDNPGNEYVVTSPFLQYAAKGKPCLVTRRKVFRSYRWQFSSIEEMLEKMDKLIYMPEEGKKLRKSVLRKHNARKVSETIWNHLSQ